MPSSSAAEAPQLVVAAREAEQGANVIDIRGRAMEALEHRLDRLRAGEPVRGAEGHGATILGDGHVALILDVSALLDLGDAGGRLFEGVH